MLLIGAYTSTLDHVVGRAPGLLRATFGDEGIADVALAAPASDPSWLTAAADGAVYAVDESGGRVAAFSTGLAPLGSVATGGLAPCHVAVSPDQRLVLVAHYGSGTVSVHRRRTGGTVSEPVAELRTGAHAHMAAFGPDETLHVPDLGVDRVARFALSPDGAATELAPWLLPAGTGPRHVVFHEEFAYVVGELANTVTTFAGGESIASASTLPDGFAGASSAAALRVHDDRLYVTNRGHDSIAVFALDPLPRLVELVRSGGRTPRDLLVLDDRLLVAHQDSDDVTTFAIEPGGLRRLGAAAVPTPVCLLHRPQ